MIFVAIEGMINDLMNTITTAAVAPQVAALGTIVSIWITLWIMARGYMVLAGKSDEPIKSLIFDLVIKVIIIMFVQNISGWLDMSISAINGLNEWASGSVSLYARLDQMYETASKVGIIMEEQDGTFEFVGLVAELIVLAGFTIVAIPAIVIIITTTFTLKILIMISPIMIFTLLFDWFKTIFTKWIELILSNTLTVLFVGVFFNILSLKYKKVIDDALTKASEFDVIALATEIFFVSLILVVLILLAKELAQQLTYVSMESLPGSAAAKGLSGAKGIAKGGYGATRGSINYTSRASIWTGNRFRRR